MVSACVYSIHWNEHFIPDICCDLSRLTNGYIYNYDMWTVPSFDHNCLIIHHCVMIDSNFSQIDFLPFNVSFLSLFCITTMRYGSDAENFLSHIPTIDSLAVRWRYGVPSMSQRIIHVRRLYKITQYSGRHPTVRQISVVTDTTLCNTYNLSCSIQKKYKNECNATNGLYSGKSREQRVQTCYALN